MLELNGCINRMFQKEKLEYLKQKYKVTMDEIIQETKPKKEFKNWKVKISKAINRKDSDPTNFGQLELSTFLANYFNIKATENGDETIPHTYFLGKQVTVECCGELEDDGTVRYYDKYEMKRLKIDSRWKGFKALYIRSGIFGGGVRLFKPIKLISAQANNRLSIVKQKTTGNIYWGYLKPLSRAKYTIQDFSFITGKKLNDIASNIEITWSTPFIFNLFPKDSDWQKD